MNKIQERLHKINVEELKEMAVELMNNFEEGSDIVFDKVSNELHERLNEDEFINFMESL